MTARRAIRRSLMWVWVLSLVLLCGCGARDLSDSMSSSKGSKAIPNLSRASDKTALNMFLSNFSESNLCGSTGSRRFDVELASIPELADLAFTNYAQNGGKVEYVAFRDCNVRASVVSLNRTLKHLCGMEVDDWSCLGTDSNDWYVYHDGYVYTQITNGFLLCGPTVATSVSPGKDGTVRVRFDAYYQLANETGYTLTGKTQYSMSERQLNKLLGVGGPNRRGTAVLKAMGTQGGWEFTLMSWELD